MTERELQDQIIRDATKLGYVSYHTHDSRRSAAGYPDLVLASPSRRRVIYAECKSDKGTVSIEQQRWLGVLAMCDQEVYVWQPKHFEEITYILTLGHKPSLAECMEMDSAVVYCEETP